ncbi:hypothetical protein JHK85_036838 [Glycine max]|nr:hypothetical protein JHK85_036838 [Glycine max]
MQTIARRLGQQSLRPSTSLKSIYPISDHHYGMDHERYVSTLATKGVGHLVRKGTGGRSSVSGIIATVFGATGFLGRYVVQQLGRDYETRNYSFEEVHYHMAEQLAKISKEHGGILRFIQVSCLGASPSSPSRMLRTKSAAEEMILRELPEATILKPAVMIGTEDRILNPWAHFAKKYGFLPLFGDGSTKIQPVYVIDVAAALTSLLKDDGTSMGKIYELGGPEIFTVHELADVMFDTIREWPRYVKVPFPIAKALATPREILLNKVPFPLPVPEILNLDKIQALTTDTVVSENALTFNDLGIVPHKLKGYPIEFLISYRKGGPQFGSTISERVTPDSWP